MRLLALVSAINQLLATTTVSFCHINLVAEAGVDAGSDDVLQVFGMGAWSPP